MGGTLTRSHTVRPAARAVVGDMAEAARRLDEKLAALPVTHAGQPRRDPSAVELEALRRYWGTGRPIRGMAEAFGVSENTLRRWAHEAGLTHGGSHAQE